MTAFGEKLIEIEYPIHFSLHQSSQMSYVLLHIQLQVKCTLLNLYAQIRFMVLFWSYEACETWPEWTVNFGVLDQHALIYRID